MAFSIYRRMSKESQQTEAVVDCDDDHSFFHQSRGVVGIAAPSRECATMNPNHHRQAFVVFLSSVFLLLWPILVDLLSLVFLPLWRIDVQEEAILTANLHEKSGIELRTLTAELSSLEYAVPSAVGLRWRPAERTDGRHRVGDAQVFIHRGCLYPLQWTILDNNCGSRRRSHCRDGAGNSDR